MRYEFGKIAYSQTKLASEIGKTKQNINQILSGKVTIMPKNVNDILDALKINAKFNLEYDFNERIYAAFLFCLKKFYFYEYVSYANEIDKFLDKSLLYSYSAAEYLIFKALKYYLERSFDKMRETLEIVKNYFSDIIDGDTKIAYLILYGEYGYEVDDFNVAKASLEEALTITTPTIPDAVGMVYFILDMIYDREYKVIKAIMYSFKAQSVFKQTSNYYCLTAENCNIGGYFKDIKEYDEAEEYPIQVTSRSKQIGKQNTTINAYASLSSLYYHKKQYLKAMDCANEALRLDINNTCSNIVVAWSIFLSR